MCPQNLYTKASSIRNVWFPPQELREKQSAFDWRDPQGLNQPNNVTPFNFSDLREPKTKKINSKNASNRRRMLQANSENHTKEFETLNKMWAQQPSNIMSKHTFVSRVKEAQRVDLEDLLKKAMVNINAATTSNQDANKSMPMAVVPKEANRIVNAAITFNQDAHKSMPSNISSSTTSTTNKGKTKKKAVAKPVIYWIRRDLRVYDNPALVEASEMGCPVIPVFLWSEVEEGPEAAGGATKLWLHHALKGLDISYREKYGSHIIFRKTNSCLKEIQKIIEETSAKTVIWDDLYEPQLKARDDKIQKALEKRKLSVRRFHSYLLHQPGNVSVDDVGMRGIGSVTHFIECSRRSATESIGHPVDPPLSLLAPDAWPATQSLDDLQLARMPRRKNGTVIDWAAPIRESWDFSEDGAYEALQLFISDGIRRYEKESSRGDQRNTCRISPYLHFGQISPRTILEEARRKKSPKFLRKLAWRDLSYWLLTLFPTMDSEPMRPHYRLQRWSSDKAHLKAWQKGNTGYPLIDAAMRELWLTGWCNNYMRHVVASFLLSYLHIHWIEGFKWFQDTLVDADVAINAMMWQNGGMSGLDQWNFVMHPVDAAMTCDPKGDYIRKWVPELADLSDDHIHRPWTCPPSILKRAKVNLGGNYPQRIVTDLEAAREQSLKDVVEVRLRFGRELVCPHTGNDLVLLPGGRKLPVITRKEFKYKTSHPEAKDNPHSAVLKGYRSRKRDEAIAFANKVDFKASTMDECVQRRERSEKYSMKAEKF